MSNNHIPKIIHYCWFGGGPLTDEAKRCIDSWKKYCPEYEIIRWDEKTFDIDSSQYTKEAYNSKKWAFVADYVRLYAIYNNGGIYMDTDVELIGNIDGFLHHCAFAGFESPKSISTCIMACEKKFKLFGEFFDYYKNRHFVTEDGKMDLTTNVEIITNICKKHGLELNNRGQTIDEFVLYPSTVFCPKNLVSGEVCKESDTVAIHHLAGSWLESGDVKLREFRMNLCNKYGYKIGVFLYKTVCVPYRLHIHILSDGINESFRKVFKKWQRKSH